jgi:hypothetical protein
MPDKNLKKSQKMESAFVEVWNNQKLTYPDMEEYAKLVVATIREKLQLTSLAKLIADIQIPVSPFWKEYVPQVKTALPKTDIMIEKWKLSMKWRQNHLIFQGGEGETLGSFYAALEDNQEDFRSYVDEVIRKHASILKNVSMANQNMIDAITNKQEPIRQSLQEFFDTNKDFQTSLLREILSGNKKFGDNKIAVANSMLLYDASNSIIFPLTKDNIYKHMGNVKVSIKWRKFNAKQMMRNMLQLEPIRVEEGVVDTIKSVMTKGWDKVLKMFGLVPDIDIEIKW